MKSTNAMTGSLLAWSLSMSVLLSACAERMGGFQAVDINKIRTSGKDQRKGGTGNPARDGAPPARTTGAGAVDLVQSPSGQGREVVPGERIETPSPAPAVVLPATEEANAAAAEAERARVAEALAHLQRVNSTIAQWTEGLHLGTDETSRTQRDKMNSKLSSLITGLDLSANRRLPTDFDMIDLEIQATVEGKTKDSDPITQFLVTSKSKDRTQALSEQTILEKGHFAELSPPVELSSGNELKKLKFAAGFLNASKKQILLFVRYHENDDQTKPDYVGVVLYTIQSEDRDGILQLERTGQNSASWSFSTVNQAQNSFPERHGLEGR